jgi:hypothetical protein
VLLLSDDTFMDYDAIPPYRDRSWTTDGNGGAENKRRQCVIVPSMVSVRRSRGWERSGIYVFTSSSTRIGTPTIPFSNSLYEPRREVAVQLQRME